MALSNKSATGKDEMKLSERILAAKGPIYKDRRERWAAEAKVLEDIAEGRHVELAQFTHSSYAEPHIVKEMRVSK